MTARAARIRTESMAVRLSKQPISEGFMLWDKGFTLGSMRLFIFKAESLPPFQLAGCLDAIAHLMVEVQENEDAAEYFQTAGEKYDMIQNPILAKVMRAKKLEAEGNFPEAIGAVEEIIKEHDEVPSTAAGKDQKTKTALARCYYYLAELLVTAGKLEEAKAHLQLSLTLGWDRIHVGYVLLGTLLQGVDDVDGALKAFQTAISQNQNCLAAYEGATGILKQKGSFEEAIPLYQEAIKLHPRTTLINDLAMVLSNAGKDSEALEFLDKYIAEPPQGELDPNAPPMRLTTLYKSKAAILADLGKFEEAIATLESAEKVDGGDPEVASMMEGIHQAEKEE